MIASIIISVLSIAATICCVFLAAKIHSSQKKANKRADERAEEGELMLRMVHAVGQLTVGTALALKHGKTNGELDDGLEELAACEKDYTNFMERVAMSTLRK